MWRARPASGPPGLMAACLLYWLLVYSPDRSLFSPTFGRSAATTVHLLPLRSLHFLLINLLPVRSVGSTDIE